MKKEIVLKPVKASLELFLKLQDKKLIRLMRPAKSVIETRTKTGAVSRFYTSSYESGRHTLICVGKRTTDVKLSWHKDNEDFLLFNPSGLKFKKLYLAVSYLKKKDFLKKLSKENLSAKDFVLVELKFDDPRLSFFTMLKNTVHGELTEKCGGMHPIFFVAEPSELKDNKIKIKNYDIKLSTEKK